MAECGRAPCPKAEAGSRAFLLCRVPIAGRSTPLQPALPNPSELFPAGPSEALRPGQKFSHTLPTSIQNVLRSPACSPLPPAPVYAPAAFGFGANAKTPAFQQEQSPGQPKRLQFPARLTQEPREKLVPARLPQSSTATPASDPGGRGLDVGISPEFTC